jgi:hypothetical protein
MVPPSLHIPIPIHSTVLSLEVCIVILADRNEADNHPQLISWLRQSTEVETGSYNQTAGSTIIYPDFVLVGGNKLVGVNRKTVGEILSSPEKVLEQIQRELAGPVEQLVLLIEGIMVPDGQLWSMGL